MAEDQESIVSAAEALVNAREEQKRLYQEMEAARTQFDRARDRANKLEEDLKKVVIVGRFKPMRAVHVGKWTVLVEWDQETKHPAMGDAPSKVRIVDAEGEKL